MPRKPKIPAYSLHKPSGRAVVKVRQRSIYLGTYGSDESREAYARIIADLLADRPIIAPTPAARTRPTVVASFTVADLAKRYRKHAKDYYRKNGTPTSEVHIVNRALEFLTENHAQLPAKAFSIGDLKVVRQAIVDAGIARTVVNQYVNRIVRTFRWGAEEELVPASVSHGLTMLSGLKAGRTKAKETEPIQPVDTEVVDATLPHLPEVVADMVRLQLLTAMRPTEVCTVRPADVDRSTDVWEYHVQGHKTVHHGKRRTVFIGPAGQEILTPYLLRPADEFCFRPKRHIAIPRKFKRYRVDSYRRAIKRACETNNIPDWSPNQLRHTAATAIRRQCGIEVARLMLGHTKLNTTEIYAEFDTSKGREVAAMIG